MSKPGNYTAYQQYKPLDNGTTQAIQHWSAFAEQKRLNDIANEQREKEFQYKIDKDIQEEREKWLEYPKIDTTGVSDVDQFKGRAVQHLYQERINIVGIMEGLKKNSPEWTKEFIKLQKLNSSVEKLKTITNQQLQDGTKYFKGRGKDFVSTDDNDNAFSNLRNLDMRLNPETMELGIVIKDPTNPENTKIITEQEALNGASPFTFIPKIDDTKWIQENIKLLNAKPPTYMDTDPATNKPILQIGYDKEKAIKPYVKTTLFIEEEPTEEGLSFGAQLGYTTKQLKDPAIQEKLVNHYTDRLHSALTGGTKLDKDSENIRIAEEKLNAKITNDNVKNHQAWTKINQAYEKMKSNDEISVIGAAAKSDSNYWLGKSYNPNDATIPVNVKYGTITSEDGVLENAVVKAYTFAKNGGVILKVENTVPATDVSPETKTVSIVSGDDAMLKTLAARIGNGVTAQDLKNISKDAFKEKQPANNTKTSSKSKSKGTSSSNKENLRNKYKY